MAVAQGEFDVTGWEETEFAELETGKLTRADVIATLKGDIDGSGRVSWLMCYRADGTADYVGFLVIEASLDGRTGGFVVRTSGAFDGGKASGPWMIVRDSGFGELVAIEGAGAFDSPHGGTTTYELSYTLPR
ncbi:MAG TPA: DUF3224 domain-containing protein [Candidatus Limnocylindrales bacterium]|jgi:hypothetical protein|nr:DUF3224 domain-containing protein [Candidatus Limnocylindrales bacterium]